MVQISISARRTPNLLGSIHLLNDLEGLCLCLIQFSPRQGETRGSHKNIYIRTTICTGSSWDTCAKNVKIWTVSQVNSQGSTLRKNSLKFNIPCNNKNPCTLGSINSSFSLYMFENRAKMFGLFAFLIKSEPKN